VRSSSGSTRRLFLIYGLITLLPVIVLGVVLGRIDTQASDSHGLTEAVARARTMSASTVSPDLQWRNLAGGLTATERREIGTGMHSLLSSGVALRARLRAADGSVVLDAAHPDAPPTGPQDDDEVGEAMEGKTVRTLSHLNADEVEDHGGHGDLGPRAVEVYLPLVEPGAGHEPIGVFEVYVPYQPIADELAVSRHHTLTALGLGLLGLWFVLGLISWSSTRRIRRNAADNEWLARHDEATGLPNLVGFRELLDERAGADANPFTVAVVTLDGLSGISDTFGIDEATQFVCDAAQRLSHGLDTDQQVARIGTQQLAIAVDGASLDDRTVGTVLAAVGADVEIDGVPVTSDVKVGMASWPIDGAEPAGVVRAAELAVHAAGEARMPVVRFHGGLERFDPERLTLLSEMRRAVSNDELRLLYQPKIDLVSGQVHSVEALIRWQHPTRGLLSPDDFIPVVESTSLIWPLTAWVIDQALFQIGEWTDDGMPLSVAVNVSPRSLRDETLPDKVSQMLERRGVMAERLEIEITETSVLADPARAAAVLRRLHEGGVRISLDDFGQGATSLAYLGRLPLDELKVDRAFVDAMTDSQEDRTIVRSVIELGHQLGLSVVGEGVETANHLELLQEYGCDVAQGYLFSRPVEPDALVRWIRDRQLALRG
jgi:EAL domain-containing protein (putative c-di-GMP-specific phosphodiesterase class I)/GGDEF domain-containing protein